MGAQHTGDGSGGGWRSAWGHAWLIRTLKFEVAVGTDGMVQGLKDATKAVDDTAQSMKFGMGKGKESVNDLTHSLQKFKAEQLQQARTARYFAQDSPGTHSDCRSHSICRGREPHDAGLPWKDGLWNGRP